MGSSGLPFPTSNNAPLPIPGGYGNPTGANTGFNFGSTSGGMFNFPAYGSPVPTSGMSNTPFPAYNVGPYTGTNMGNLSAGLMGYGQGYGTEMYNALGKAYGRGTGQLLGNLLSGQLYNPQVAAAYLNAQQPGIARGEAGILGAFGDAGARFSSAAALGMGDYESQVQLNQQQMLAQLYQNAQAQELSVLHDVLPTLQAEQANKGGWMNDIVGGLEVAGGIALDVATAGAATPLAAGLVSGGVKTLAGGHGMRGGSVSPYAASPYGPNAGGYQTNPWIINDNWGPQGGSWHSQSPIPGVDPYIQPTFGTPGALQASGGGLWSGGGISGDNPDLPIPFYE